MEKILYLQSLRAVAAILVVWAHAIDLASKRNLDGWHLDGGAIENFGAVGVDIFFVISGFIVSISAERTLSAQQFLIKRWLRIWPLYAIATLLVFCMSPSEWGRLDRLMYSLLFIQEPGIPSSMPTHPLGWSLFYEMAFYLMLALTMCWNSLRPIGERVLCFLAIAVCVASMQKFQQPLNIFGNPIVVDFAMGVWLGLIWKKYPILPKWAFTSLFFLGSALLVQSVFDGFGLISEAPYTLNALLSWERVKLWGVPSALLVASAIFRPQSTSRKSIFIFIGDASYSIYLFSLPALLAIDSIWSLLNYFPVDVRILISAFIATVAGVVAYLIIERPLVAIFSHRNNLFKFTQD